MGRFVNADAAEFALIIQTSQATNLFAYCENNCVNEVDIDGHYTSSLYLSSSIVSALSGALSGIISGISTSVASITTAISTSWVIPVCIAAVCVAIVAIVYLVNRVKYLYYSKTKTISSVKSKIKADGVNSNKLGNYTVYVIVRNNTTDVVYVGITKNYSKRCSAHKKRFSPSSYRMLPIATWLTKQQARALEQTIISAYGLDTLQNMINSISPKKWSYFKTEFNQMKTLIQSWSDPE